jgi:hypothetical protein
MITTWMSQDIRSLPRQKLIEIIEQLGREIQETRDAHMRDLRFLQCRLGREIQETRDAHMRDLRFQCADAS